MKYLLLFTFVALLFASPAMSLCNDPRPRLICAEYFASKVVVEATLVRVRSIRDKEDPEGVAAYKYTLRTDHVIRGSVDSIFAIREGNDSGRATFDWKTGRKYLLFLFYSNYDKAWELDGCGNSGPVSRAKVALKQIAAIQASQGDGFIYGVVGPSMPGVHVVARGAIGRFTTTTNSKGEFHIKVPAGHYVVRAIKAGFSFATGEFSYENPDKLQIEPGGCAQVQLVGVSGALH